MRADSNPRLSIIIATWNAAPTLERCLSSLFGQSFADWELLVADGGSTDGTVDLIREHESRIAWWQSREDKGIYDAWNQALAHIRGEYVCFLGADDAWADDEVLLRMFAAIGDGRYDLVTSRGLLRDRDWRALGTIGTSWGEARLPRRIRVCHPGLLHHRSLFERYGLFDSRFQISADFDFLLRLPPDIMVCDYPHITVDVQNDGISRGRFWQRIREYRLIHAQSPRIGPAMAWVYWADKAWRRPIARLLDLSH